MNAPALWLMVAFAVLAVWLAATAEQLTGVGVHDPLVFGIAPLVLAVTTLVATVIPARRASRTPPQVALRGDSSAAGHNECKTPSHAIVTSASLNQLNTIH